MPFHRRRFQRFAHDPSFRGNFIRGLLGESWFRSRGRLEQPEDPDAVSGSNIDLPVRDHGSHEFVARAEMVSVKNISLILLLIWIQSPDMEGTFLGREWLQ
jgi:hypothetical protein